jgi:manganese/iron transport system permease protein
MLHAVLVAPFESGFMQNALLTGALVATVCALLSCFLVLRGWALMGDAISHAVLPGLVMAAFLGLPVAIGAAATGLICGFGSGYFRETRRIKPDTALGIVFSGLFALGLVLHSILPTGQDIHYILFGNLLGVTSAEILETAIVALPTGLMLVALRRDFLLVSFDRAHAQAIGRPVRGLEALLIVALVLTIVAALTAVGVILVVALLVAPGAIGWLATDRFDRMLIVAVLAGLLATVIGLLVSFHLNAASGPLIVLAETALFLAALVFAPKRGLVAQRRAVARAIAAS